MPSRATTPGRPTLRQGKARQKMFGVRPPGATAGEILPVPPLIKEGTQKPPFVKGAARSAGGFGHVAVMKRTFASSISRCRATHEPALRGGNAAAKIRSGRGESR